MVFPCRLGLLPPFRRSALLPPISQGPLPARGDFVPTAATDRFFAMGNKLRRTERIFAALIGDRPALTLCWRGNLSSRLQPRYTWAVSLKFREPKQSFRPSSFVVLIITYLFVPSAANDP